ncbi:hypothetical protein ACH4OY_12290 [Micromonospora rubida]|uniref:Tryptophan--tRNA ligase n=1 Tax=Micromonospora rubida TaxID=2697657 RepID=A0ABW7SLQ5_9ACTN
MRFLAGARPTGSLHVGHCFGMLDSLVRQANDENAELFFVVADLHMFTTTRPDPRPPSSRTGSST